MKEECVLASSNDMYNAAPKMLEALELTFQRLAALNRDDEAGIRIVLANAIKEATGHEPVLRRSPYPRP
jgi:hypothetical protein